MNIALAPRILNYDVGYLTGAVILVVSRQTSSSACDMLSVCVMDICSDSRELSSCLMFIYMKCAIFFSEEDRAELVI
jgi:hypothetical protein